MKKYARLWILPFFLVLVSLGALRLARACWDSLVHFRPPQFSVEPGEKAAPAARVVLVVVDGLRVDALEGMAYVSALKGRSAFFVLKTGQPSLSLPSSAVIGTGAWPEVTGVTTNWYDGAVRLDSLFSLAKDGGRAAVIVGGDGWGTLFGSHATGTYTRVWKDAYNTFDEESLTKAVDCLSGNPSLLLVHFLDTDLAGHDFGGASARYREAAAHIDGLIARLHGALDDAAVLIVTADHGHLDTGGHGGWERVVTTVPFLMCGRPVRPGSYGTASQADVAPTVAALAGLPIPPYSQGRILDEALDLGGETERLVELQSAQKAAFARAYLGAIGTDLEETRRRLAPAPGEDEARTWDRVLAAGKKARISADRVRRVPLFLAVLLLPAAALWYFGKRSRIPARLPLALALLFFAAHYSFFFASGKRLSLSAINDEGRLQAFLNETMLYAALSAVVMAVLAAFVDRKKSGWDAAVSALLMTAAVAFLIILQVDVFILSGGPLLSWHIPGMFLAFKYYLDLTALIAVGFVSLIIPAVALGAHRLWRSNARPS